MQTGEISEKIERGKHTTRHSELIAISEDTYIMRLVNIGNRRTYEFTRPRKNLNDIPLIVLGMRYLNVDVVADERNCGATRK